MIPQPYTFASRLKVLREQRGLSKTAIAKAVGVSTTCVWNWEEGNTNPRSENLWSLSSALNTSVEYLESGADWDGASEDRRFGSPVPPTITLATIIAEAKVRIAEAAGIKPEKVNISLDY